MPVDDQGIMKERYQIIPRVLVFAIKDNNVLLLKGAPTKRLWANLYNGVGGHIEAGEDVLSAAQREFHEETGLTLQSVQLRLLVMIDTQNNPGIGMYVFRGTANEGALIASEEGELEWVSFDDIENYPLVEDLPEILPLVINAKESDPIVSAQYTYTPDEKLTITYNSIS